MTKTQFKNLITNNFVFADGENITEEEKNNALDQLIINCDNETVNPDKDTRPVVRG